MSDSSDDDVLNLLPTGGGGGGGRFQRPAPKRNRNFAAMLGTDTDSDDDVKHKPKAAAAPKAKPAPPPSSSDDSSDDDSSSASISFEPQAVAVAAANRSASPRSASSATEVNFVAEAPAKKVSAPAAKPVAAPPPPSSSASSMSGTQSFKAMPVSADPPPRQKATTPVSVASPTTPAPAPAPEVAYLASPNPTPTPNPAQQHMYNGDGQYDPNSASTTAAGASGSSSQYVTYEPPRGGNLQPPPFANPSVPAYSAPQQSLLSGLSTNHNLQQQYGRGHSTGIVEDRAGPHPPMPGHGGGTYQAQTNNQSHSMTPMRTQRAAPDRLETNVDELLARAQQRLRERQYNTNANTNSSSSVRAQSPNIRTGTPLRSVATPTGPSANGRYGSVGRGINSSSSGSGGLGLGLALAAPPLLPPDFSKESRAQKETQRLNDEVAFLASENNRLRNHPASFVTAASTVEITKLEVQLEVAKKQCRDVEVEAQRTRRVLEEQLRDVSEHRNSLQDEISACLKSVAQFEQMARDKDSQLMQEQAMNMRIKTDLAEAQQEAARYRDDLSRQSIEWSAKIDRNLALLEDMKRQRNHLTELNEKISRDKDNAVSERKKLFDDLRHAMAERNREKDAAAEELSALKREVDRYRTMLQDKERLMNAQLAEERKAKETIHAKLLEIEGSSNKGVKSLDVQLRAQQDEHRHVTQRLQDQLHSTEAELRRAKQETEELRAMLGTKTERERFDQQQEYNDHVFRLRKELDDTLVVLRNTESARDLALRDAERYKEELKGASGIVAQWKSAKEKVEAQNHQLTTTIALLMNSDDGHSDQREHLKAQIDAQDMEIRQLQSELEQTYEIEGRLKELMEENERLSRECDRLSNERDELVDENGKMATEVLKWRDEVKDMLLRNNGKLGIGASDRSSRPATAAIAYNRR